MVSIPPEANPSGSSALGEPELLPPDGRYVPPTEQEPVRQRRRPVWAAAPATHLLVGINCAVFLLMMARGVSPISPDVNQLLGWGANHAGAVLIYGEWMRILSAMFIHVGIIHLATNMWCLWNLGLLAEPLIGSFGLAAAYVLTGAAGNMLSVLVNWSRYYQDWGKYHDIGVFPAGAGASGAVFGIAGVLIVLLKSNRLPVPPQELKKLRKSVIYFAVINLAIGFSISFGTRVIGTGLNIDNMAHLGGFASGLLFAAPLVPRIGSPRNTFNTRLRVAIIMVAILLVMFGFYMAQLPPRTY